ncbi:MAG: FAD-dependent oxidoreductase, partial [Sphingomonadaceae bacterium]
LLRLKAAPHVRFAGQITGVEGYVESAAIGLLAGRFAEAEARGKALSARLGGRVLAAYLQSDDHLKPGGTTPPP